MADKPPDAFLSYTRFDDRHDGGKISEFRLRLADAVRAVTGAPFEIFQDVDGIDVGERWSETLDEMLVSARFFIPILTPSYFQSEACRDELEKFLKAEERAGREDLILPIYYIQCAVLEEEEQRRADHLASTIDGRQRWDWRDLRHHSLHNRKVRLQIEALARAVATARQSRVPRRLEPIGDRAAVDEGKVIKVKVTKVGVQANSANADLRARDEPDTLSRIFLAHASEDKALVRRLYTELKALRLNPWLDEIDLLPGQIWKTEIAKAIREAKVFLACLSSRSVKKVGFVQNEFRLALSALGERPPGSIYLIPVRLDACTVPDLQIPDTGLSLKDIHWVDLWQDDGLDRLVRSVEHALGAATASRYSEEGQVEFLPLHQTVGYRKEEQNPAKALAAFRDIAAPWCPEMVEVPAGEFMMGSADGDTKAYAGEKPQHLVRIGYRFAIGRYPMTFEEFDRFAAATKWEPPGDRGWGRGRRPVINVSWNDAKAYVEWLTQETGQPYRLPSEAEWEYACRAGTTTRYWWGDGITAENANFEGIVRQTSEVGAYPANRWGLCDMHGNVWEWVEDRWHDNYAGAPNDGTAWTEGKHSRRVLRGGAWNYIPGNLRAASRLRVEPDVRGNNLGFRVARTLTLET